MEELAAVPELTFRQAVAAALAQEMARDPNVVLLGEDVRPGGVFKTTVGLLEKFGPERVWDTPISETAIVGTAMGAAMAGMRPVAEIMFSDFYGTCWDQVAVEIAKARYMTGGQVSLPLVVRGANGGGLGFGAQHSQAVENWCLAVPGLKIVSPATPADMLGLLAAAIRDDDPVLVFEHKALFGTKGEVPDGEHVIPLGQANVLRTGPDEDAAVTIVGLSRTVGDVPAGRRRARRLGGVRRGDRPAHAGPAGRGGGARLGAAHRAGGDRRGEPRPARLGRRDRRDPRRGGVRRPRRPGHPGHPAATSRCRSPPRWRTR